MTRNLTDITLRIGLAGASLILFNSSFELWNQGTTFSYPLLLVVCFVLWGLGAGCAILALLTTVRAQWRWVILLALLLMPIQQAYLSQVNYTPATDSLTDNEMIAQMAVQALKRGQNPYAWNFTDIRRVFRDRGILVTPFLDGTYQNRVTYPILPTLVLAGFDFIGLGQPRIVALLCYLLLITLLFLGSPALLQPLVLFPLLLLRNFSLFTLGGLQDVVWSTLLVLMILAWKRPFWRALLFGLACAYRQQPWLVAPFLLIEIWNQPSTSWGKRWRPLPIFLAISIGTFLVINLPFILADPSAWFLGTFEPGYARFNVYSHGLATLTQYGIINLPREVYTILQLSVYAILLIVHWRHPYVVGQAFWVFPGVFFWLFYRGLANYWVYWIPPMLMALVTQFAKPLPALTEIGPRRKIRTTLVMTVPLAAASLLLVIFVARQAPAITASYVLPLGTSNDGRVITRITMTVENHSNRAFTPRFAVQRDPSVQALPWSIESGPTVLEPGETAPYTIYSGDILTTSAAVQRGSQVVVSDAGGDYSQRAVVTLPTGNANTNPDRIINPDYSMWPTYGNAPVGWTLQTITGVNASCQFITYDGRGALQLIALHQNSLSDLPITRLTQTVIFPSSLAVWVHPTRPAANLFSEMYGLEVDDGRHRLWILFGDSDEYGSLSLNSAFVYQRAPLNIWTRQIIDLPSVYQRLGWPIPAYSMRNIEGVAYPARQVKVSWIAASNNTASVTWYFGPIEQSPGALNTPPLSQVEMFTNRNLYYTLIGDEYLRERNADLAQAAYRQAIVYDATNATSFYGLGETYLLLQDAQAALTAFNSALKLGNYQRPGLIHSGVGRAYYQLAEYDKAINSLTTAVQLMRAEPDAYERSSIADAYFTLGLANAETNACDQAKQALDMGRQLKPESGSGQANILKCGLTF
jgi:hypothetical protein